MRIGYFAADPGVELTTILDNFRRAAELGYPSAWAAELGGWDALTVLTAAAAVAPGIELGTGVVVSYPRHPRTLAAQALTIHAATGNRLTLGIGVSHRHVIEGDFGLSFDRPARHLREYLTALLPLLRGESVDFHGETLSASGGLLTPGAKPPQVLLGALGPAMLRVARDLADGVVTTWSGPDILASHIIPVIGDKRLVASGIVALTTDPDTLRNWISEQYGIAAELPAYRAIFDRQGMQGPADTLIAGDEDTVRRELTRFAEAGATDFVAMPIGSAEERRRTTEFLATLG